jgi:3-hydroxyisobutyrate dehydrogenase-like beta-hydroxyacid dehydrogenase
VAEKSVGVIGVGRMGSRMARRVIQAGFPVSVYDVSAEAVAALVRAGARPVATAAEAAAMSDVVLTMLPDPQAVETALLGVDGIVAGIRPGSVVVEMSTISPSLTRRMGLGIEARGAHYLDCPVSGGPTGAEKGTLTLMVGGKASALEMCRKVLETMAATIYHLGEIGAGLTAKLINQLLTMTQTVLVTEALAIGARGGMNLNTLYEMIGRSSGTSWCWQNRIPRILKDSGEIWVTLDICHKDLGLAKALGEEVGVPLFVASGAYQVLQMAKAMNLGAEDVSALGRLYERMLGVEMRATED